MTEAWLTKNEITKILRISGSTFEKCYPLFKQGIHYRMKNPARPQSPRLWRLSKVEEALAQPHHNQLRMLKG
jgi:hypothetical protein